MTKAARSVLLLRVTVGLALWSSLAALIVAGAVYTVVLTFASAPEPEVLRQVQGTVVALEELRGVRRDGTVSVGLKVSFAYDAPELDQCVLAVQRVEALKFARLRVHQEVAVFYNPARPHLGMIEADRLYRFKAHFLLFLTLLAVLLFATALQIRPYLFRFRLLAFGEMRKAHIIAIEQRRVGRDLVASYYLKWQDSHGDVGCSHFGTHDRIYANKIGDQITVFVAPQRKHYIWAGDI